MTVSIADVDQAEAELATTKAAYYADKSDENKAAFDQAKRNVVAVRFEWRTQEAAAGRRGGLVGGDAVTEE